jgi:hypothetical protein
MSTVDTARKIAGDNSRLGRSTADFYPTPPNATLALLENEKFEGEIWECACGKGDISKVLIAKGYDVISSDINDYGYGMVNVDFLNDHSLFDGPLEMDDNIITNPPFELALEFVLQAKRFSRLKIAMFLKTAFLEGVKRYEMFQDKKYPLKCIYQFSKRVNFGIHAGTHKNGGMIPFAWFVWERGYVGKPYINWIP